MWSLIDPQLNRKTSTSFHHRRVSQGGKDDLGIGGMAQCSMKHENVRWNAATQEWFCAKCGRTSDHASEQDAHFELEQHECKMDRNA